MTVKEIVKQWLEANGYDGLCNDIFECGCELNDLMPCQEDVRDDCAAGHKVLFDRSEDDSLPTWGGDWVIQEGKKDEI